MDRSKEIVLIEKQRETVEVILNDGRIFRGSRNTSIGEFLKLLPEWKSPPIVSAVVDGELRELTYLIRKDAVVKPVTMHDSDGSKIYRRSLIFLLQAAFEKDFPNIEFTVDHSVPNGGYFCTVIGRRPLSPKEVTALEKHMYYMVEADMPILREQVLLRDAIEYFKRKGYHDKLRLLKYRKKPHLVLYRLGSHRDYHHGYMVPSTGFLEVFSLLPRGEGFILQYPRRKTPTKLFPMPEYTKLRGLFQQYSRWLASLGISSVGALNDAILSGSIREVILVSEALHEQKISAIVNRIIEKLHDVRIILIAGPTSSGKTTFSKRLAIQLLASGVSPFALELDNYFVDRDKTPRDEQGNLNFEAFEAINNHLLETNLLELIAGKKVQLPRFNFKSGKSEPGDVIQLKKDQLIILEGIHGLNTKLLTKFSSKNIFRIYISCLTQLNLDRFNRISTTDTRMLRRIVRDAKSRGFSAQRTIGMWESVRRGERENIFPYQENADEIFNSALVYELAALKPLAEPLLRQIRNGTDEYLEAKRLLAFLEWFLPVEVKLIPDNSIVREFIGDSILSNFKLWVGSQDESQY
ncbi:MAG TPA: nucleoside kinase [Anaerolineae bacterium]|nr:nucleoside kinase [Anaerolineae bacterium]